MSAQTDGEHHSNHLPDFLGAPEFPGTMLLSPRRLVMEKDRQMNSSYTYAHLATDLFAGKFPIIPNPTWHTVLTVFERASARPLASMPVDFPTFAAVFPEDAPSDEVSHRCPSGAVYKRWRKSMLNLHRVSVGTGDAWEDLVRLGYLCETSGLYLGHTSHLRAELRSAGLDRPHPACVDREAAVEANAALDRKNRIKLRSACNTLDLLRKQPLIIHLGLLSPEPIGTLPKRTKSGTFLADLPPGLAVFASRPAKERDVIRTVHFTARRLGLVSDEDVSPEELLDAVTRDTRAFDDLAQRMTANSVKIYRQRAVRLLEALDRRPKPPDLSWEALCAALRQALPIEAPPHVNRFGILRVACKKAGLVPSAVTTEFIAHSIAGADPLDRGHLRVGARLMNELFELGDDFALFRPKDPIDISALPGKARIARAKTLRELMG